MSGEALNSICSDFNKIRRSLEGKGQKEVLGKSQLGYSVVTVLSGQSYQWTVCVATFLHMTHIQHTNKC